MAAREELCSWAVWYRGHIRYRRWLKIPKKIAREGGLLCVQQQDKTWCGEKKKIERTVCAKCSKGLHGTVLSREKVQ
jgi:hypothetical protein